MRELRSIHKSGDFKKDKTCDSCVNLIYPQKIIHFKISFFLKLNLQLSQIYNDPTLYEPLEFLQYY